MAVDFMNSETKGNLMRAFAGESQARNRYTFAAGQARQQKLYVLERIFQYTADQEKEHAEIFYNFLKEAAGETIQIDGGYPVDISDSMAEILRMAKDEGYAFEEMAVLVRDMARYAPLLEAANVTLLVEPLNDVKDHKGYYLTDSLEGFALVEEAGSPRVRLLYDVYHQLHMGEDVLSRIEAHLPLIGHFHIAGFPDRDEKLFGGGFDYRALFALLRERSVQVPVGVELFPSDAAQTPELLAKLLPFA